MNIFVVAIFCLILCIHIVCEIVDPLWTSLPIPGNFIIRLSDHDSNIALALVRCLTDGGGVRATGLGRFGMRWE